MAFRSSQWIHDVKVLYQPSSSSSSDGTHLPSLSPSIHSAVFAPKPSPVTKTSRRNSILPPNIPCDSGRFHQALSTFILSWSAKVPLSLSGDEDIKVRPVGWPPGRCKSISGIRDWVACSIAFFVKPDWDINIAIAASAVDCCSLPANLAQYKSLHFNKAQNWRNSSCDMTPSNSLTALGPTLFFSALHCANTLNLLTPPQFSPAANSVAGMAILGTHHQPLRSTPPSLAPPTWRRDIDIDLLRNERACFSNAVPTSSVVWRMGMGMGRTILLEIG